MLVYYLNDKGVNYGSREKLKKIVCKTIAEGTGTPIDFEEGHCLETPCASCIFSHLPKAIINAGYGDTKQAVREFAERLKQALFVNCTILRRIDDPIEEDMRSEEVNDTIDLLLAEVCGE